MQEGGGSRPSNLTMELRVDFDAAPGLCVGLPPCVDGRCKFCEATEHVARRVPAVIEAMIVQDVLEGRIQLGILA